MIQIKFSDSHDLKRANQYHMMAALHRVAMGNAKEYKLNLGLFDKQAEGKWLSEKTKNLLREVNQNYVCDKK